MTQVTEIIRDSFRQSNLLPLGVAPTIDQQSEALVYLNRIVKSVFGREAGEDLSDFPVGSENIERPQGYPYYDTLPDNNWFMSGNLRLVCNLDQPLNLFLTPEPEDGARFAVVDVLGNFNLNNVTIKANGRNIETASELVLNTNETNDAWFYRADTANWMRYTSLEPDNDFPFPEEFDDFFITMLAIRLNPAYGRALDEQSNFIFKRSRSQFRARYTQTKQMRSELGLIRLSRMSYQRDGYRYFQHGDYDTTTRFNKGRVY